MDTDNTWRMREHLHRCPDCLKYSNCGGTKNRPCGKPYLVKCPAGECGEREVKGKSNE